MAKGQTQTQTTSIDPQAEAYRQQVYNAATNLPEFTPYGGQTVAGPSQQTMQGFETMQHMDPRLQQGYGGMVGNLGLANQYYANQMGGAGSFANADMAAYQNPYQQQVIEATQSDYDRLRQQGLNQVGAGATRAGAFGGARHGLAEATRMAELGRAETGQLAGLRQTGFESAAQKWQQDQQMQMRNAQMMSNLGLAGAQGLNALQQQRGQAQIGAGEYGRGIDQQRLQSAYQQWMMQQQAPYQRLSAMQAGGGMPTGQTTELFMPFDPWQTAIGAATAIGGMIPG